MLASLLCIVGTFTISVTALPPLSIRGDESETRKQMESWMGGFEKPEFCLSRETAMQVGDLWRGLLSNYTKADADAALTTDYHDYSASALSLNSVCQQAPGPSLNATDPVFTNRTIFEMAQGSQASIPSTRLTTFHSCHEVTMRYEMTIKGQHATPVVGLIVIQVVEAPMENKYPFKICRTYSEFDSQAWVKSLQAVGMCISPGGPHKA